MKDRLLQLLEAEKLTALKFAEIMEVRPSNISHILSGRNNPGFEFISRLLQRFPEVNPDWVINGIGTMYRGDLGLVSMENTGADFVENASNESNTQMATLFSELNEKPVDFLTENIAQVHVEMQQYVHSENVNLQASTPQQTTSEKITVTPQLPDNSDKDLATQNGSNIETPCKLKQILMIFDDNTFELITPRK